MQKVCPFKRVEQRRPGVSYLTEDTVVFLHCVGENCALAVPVRKVSVREPDYDEEFECAFLVMAARLSRLTTGAFLAAPKSEP